MRGGPSTSCVIIGVGYTSYNVTYPLLRLG
jgi:hypothetical protein